MNVALGLAAWIATRWKLSGEWADARGARFDAFGTGLYAAGLVLLMYGLSRLPDAAGAWLLGLGLAVLGLFVRWQLAAPWTCASFVGTAPSAVEPRRGVRDAGHDAAGRADVQHGGRMLVLTLFVGREPITPDRHAAFVAAVRVAFAMFSGLCGAGIFASLARGAGSAR